MGKMKEIAIKCYNAFCNLCVNYDPINTTDPMKCARGLVREWDENYTVCSHYKDRGM